MLLYCVVGEMDVGVSHFVEVEEVARRPDVSLLVPVCFGLIVVVGDHHVGSDVEFPAVVKQRPNQVLLDDDRSFLLLLDAFAHPLPDVF